MRKWYLALTCWNGGTHKDAVKFFIVDDIVKLRVICFLASSLCQRLDFDEKQRKNLRRWMKNVLINWINLTMVTFPEGRFR